MTELGPLWEPKRPHPLLELEVALDRLVDIEARLAVLLREERRINLGYFLGATALLFLLVCAFALLGASIDLAALIELAASIGLVWLVIAAIWLWGRPLEVRGYWFFPAFRAAPGSFRFAVYRSLPEELYDAWIGVHQLEAADLKARVQDAGLRLVLIVVESAWSLRDHPARTSAV